jgi:hypothetical protein
VTHRSPYSSEVTSAASKAYFSTQRLNSASGSFLREESPGCLARDHASRSFPPHPGGSEAATSLQIQSWKRSMARLASRSSSLAYTYAFTRRITGQPGLLINTGSVGLPYDSDSRPAYLILDGSTPSIRRVEYNVEKELKALATCGLPGAGAGSLPCTPPSWKLPNGDTTPAVKPGLVLFPASATATAGRYR